MAQPIRRGALKAMRLTPIDTMHHPLVGTFERLAGLHPYFQLATDPRSGTGWVQVGGAGGVDEWTLRQIRTTLSRVGVDDGSIAATTVASDVGWLAAHAVAAMFVERRLPRFVPENLWTRPADAAGDPDEVAISALRFDCLPDDSAAEHPDAVVVSGSSALRGRFHALITERLTAPVINRLTVLAPVGRKALWGMVTSSWATAYAYAGFATGRSDAARAEAEQLIGSDPRTALAPPIFYLTDDGAATRLRHWRGSCCLYYRAPTYGYCEGTCPLLPAGRNAYRLAHDR